MHNYFLGRLTGSPPTRTIGSRSAPPLGIGYLSVDASIRTTLTGALPAPRPPRSSLTVGPAKDRSRATSAPIWPGGRPKSGLLLRGDGRYILVKPEKSEASITDARASAMLPPVAEGGRRSSSTLHTKFRYDRDIFNRGRGQPPVQRRPAPARPRVLQTPLRRHRGDRRGAGVALMCLLSMVVALLLGSPARHGCRRGASGRLAGARAAGSGRCELARARRDQPSRATRVGTPAMLLYNVASAVISGRPACACASPSGSPLWPTVIASRAR